MSLVEVVPADRKAAASLIKEWGGEGFRANHHISIQAGYGDDSAIVQAFARHRITSIKDYSLDVARG